MLGFNLNHISDVGPWWHHVTSKLPLIQYIPRNMHTVFALLCFVVIIHWLIFPYPSGLLHWHCGNLTIAPVPAKQPRWIWINTSCEFIMNDYITTTKQSTTKPCAYFLGYTVRTYILWAGVAWFIKIMMTSSNGNIFHVTGPLCGEFTGHRWIPGTKASHAKLSCFLWFASGQTVEQPIETIWDAIALIMTPE